MARLALAFTLAIALFAGRAGAEEPQDSGTTVTAERQPKHWYGWQILALDTTAITTMALGSEKGEIFFPAYAAYGLGAPIAHLANRNVGGAVASLGLRVIGSAVGLKVTYDNCHDVDYEQRVECPIEAGFAILALASGIDAAFLAYSTPAPPEPPTVDTPSPHRERTPHRRERPPGRFSFLSVTPTVGAAPHGVFVGATGTF